jgi:2-succinyl-6-hydroxy-2,4-cyclohexadiene-1-carboxylate synthase
MHLLFLHGFLGNKRDWDSVIRHLPFRCTALDLPGHGEGQTDLFGAMRELESFHLVGYSMGGRLALQYPGKVESLTLLSTHLGLKSGHAERLLHDEQIAKEILEMPIDAFLKKWYDQPLFRTLREKMDICSMRKVQNREGLAEAVVRYSLAHQADYSGRECLRLVGEHDEKYQDRNATVVPDAGHAVHLENPEFIAKEIHDYVLRMDRSKSIH